MKRFSFFILVLAFLFTSGVFVFAAADTADTAAAIKSASFVPSKVVFDGRELYLRHDPLVGIVREGETGVRHYMPLKAVLEQMGYIVNFDDARNLITVITPGVWPGPHVSSISATSTFASGGIRAAAYNDYTLVINGVEMDLQSDKIISVLRGTEAHPTFFMPVRPILESLGYFVGWDDKNSTAIVASDSYFSNYGTLKAGEPEIPEAPEEENVIDDVEILDDAENATEPLPSPNMSPEEVTFISLDEAVANAITILSENLQDPSSLEFHEIRYTGDELSSYTVYIDFSSRNALGGYVRRIAEVGIDGGLIVDGETQIEGAADNTIFYTAIRMAFQSAQLYGEY